MPIDLVHPIVESTGFVDVTAYQEAGTFLCFGSFNKYIVIIMVWKECKMALIIYRNDDSSLSQ